MFKLQKRTFPVDFAYGRRLSYTMYLTLPEGCELLEWPENISIDLPNNGGQFMRTIYVNGNQLQVLSDMVIRNPHFEPEEYQALRNFYDRFRKLKSLRGWLYRADGKRIRKLKEKQDVKDYSAISGYSLYEDHRVKSARLYHDVYPYTVVFEYEVAHAGLISWPAWYPQWFPEPVEISSYEISVPADTPVRYYTRR